MTRLVDGKAMAGAVLEQAASSTADLRGQGISPALAVLVATDDEATAWYVRSIQRAAATAGVSCQVHQLPGTARAAEITGALRGLSADPAVHGIICQTPLPPGISLATAGAAIAAGKDVDGANPASLGRLAAGLPGAFPPATAAAVLEILRQEQIPLSGSRAVVVGRSTVVGKPVALLLLAADATVTVCHSRTLDLAAVCRTADVLVVAVGRARMIGASYVAPGAVVIDAGTNPVDGGLVGDVDTAAVEDLASVLTPVPGGVGAVTTAVLILHTVRAAQHQADGAGRTGTQPEPGMTGEGVEPGHGGGADKDRLAPELVAQPACHRHRQHLGQAVGGNGPARPVDPGMQLMLDRGQGSGHDRLVHGDHEQGHRHGGEDEDLVCAVSSGWRYRVCGRCWLVGIMAECHEVWPGSAA